MEIKTIHKTQYEFPFLLKQINDPPDKIFIKGSLPSIDTKILTVVGARKHTEYGKEVCENLIQGLNGYNICIVSGLALGIDSIAHRTALYNNLQTIAFPGSGLNDDVLYPRNHINLANEILEKGGALISEFEMDQIATPWTFPKRNRLMAGISHATLVIEAELQSGTLITSKHASEYNRDVGVVPGNILSSLSHGPNMLLRLGAIPIRNSEDILEMLGIKIKEEQGSKQKILPIDLTDNERKIYEIKSKGINNIETIIEQSGLNIVEFNIAMTGLEMKGL
jgi:DNA processing protein